MATVDEQLAKLGYQASSAKRKRSHHRKPGGESPDVVRSRRPSRSLNRHDPLDSPMNGTRSSALEGILFKP